jgi:hypothetical protein
MVRMLARLFGGPQYSSPGSAMIPRQRDELPGDGQLAGLGVEVVAVQGGGLAAAQAAQRDQPPQRCELCLCAGGRAG